MSFSLQHACHLCPLAYNMLVTYGCPLAYNMLVTCGCPLAYNMLVTYVL